MKNLLICLAFLAGCSEPTTISVTPKVVPPKIAAPIYSMEEINTFERCILPTVCVRTNNWPGGSGVIIKDRYILTARHLLVETDRDTGAERVRTDWIYSADIVYGNVRQQLELKIVAVGPNNMEGDWAIFSFKQPRTNLPTKYKSSIAWGLPVRSAIVPTETQLLEVGLFDPIEIVGFPTGSFFQKIVSGKMEIGERVFGSHSAPMVFGNSGGPIFHAKTKILLGINVRVGGVEVPGELGNIRVPVYHISLFIPIQTLLDEINNLP